MINLSAEIDLEPLLRQLRERAVSGHFTERLVENGLKLRLVFADTEADIGGLNAANEEGAARRQRAIAGICAVACKHDIVELAIETSALDIEPTCSDDL
nr:hypothetical protein [Rhizobium sp. P32RR-XVIII]